jgi:type IV pilus assembly protein PilO
MSQRDQIILPIVLIIAVYVIFGYWALGGWTYFRYGEEVAKLQKDQADLKATIAENEAKVAALDQIRQERERLEAQLRELEKKLPREREIPELLRRVETLAGKAGLRIVQLRRLKLEPQEMYVEIPSEIGVSGNYQELLRLTDELAKLDRLVTMTEAHVVRRAPQALGLPPAADADPGGIRARIVAVVFQTLPEPPPAAAGAKAK